MNFEDLSSIFMARYDPERDEILNCREGTIFWHHENRHRKQHKDGLLKKLANFEMFLLLTIIALVAQDYVWARIFLVIWALYYGFFEIDACIYMIYAKIQDWTRKEASE